MKATKAKFDWLVFLHRYIGLVLGLWLCAVGTSGAILAYYREIDVFLHPELFAAKNSPQHPDLDAMIARVQTAYPDRFILYLERYALGRDETYPFILTEPLPRTATGLDLSSVGNYDAAMDFQVFVDPASAEIVGARSYWTWINVLRGFHRELFTPPYGRKVMGAVALSLFISAVIGGVLWWRDARKHFKRSISLRLSAAAPRLIRDGHTVFGFYATLFIGWLSLSAVFLCYGGLMREAADWILRAGKPAQNFESTALTVEKSSPPATQMISFNTARDTALTEHANSDVVLIRMPKSAAGRITFRLYPTDQDLTVYTRQVYVDAGSGEIVGRFDPARQPWSDSLFGLWLIWFHNGTMLGDVGRVFNIFAGVVLASLFPTGIYIWWKKRRARMPKRVVAAGTQSHIAVSAAE